MTALSRLPQKDIIGDVVDRLLAEADVPMPLEYRALLAWMDGMITAAIIGPVEVSADELLYALPTRFEEAERGVADAMRSILTIRRGQLRQEILELKEDFEPDFLNTIESREEEMELAREWAHGFRTAMWFKPGAWADMNASADALASFSAIGILMLSPREEQDAEAFDKQCWDSIPYIGEAVWQLRQFWRRQVPKKSLGRDLAKLGRNSICGCGSGKKFKRCCMN